MMCVVYLIDYSVLGLFLTAALKVCCDWLLLSYCEVYLPQKITASTPCVLFNNITVETHSPD